VERKVLEWRGCGGWRNEVRGRDFRGERRFCEPVVRQRFINTCWGRGMITPAAAENPDTAIVLSCVTACGFGGSNRGQSQMACEHAER